MWALQANEAFTHVYSGGRDRKIYCTDLRNPDLRVLICEEKASVLRVSGAKIVEQIHHVCSYHWPLNVSGCALLSYFITSTLYIGLQSLEVALNML